MKLKVLFWLKEFPKFSETFIRDQIVGLINSGHEVHIYSLKKNGGQLDALKGLEDLHLFEKAQSPGTLLPASKRARLKSIRSILKRTHNRQHKKLLLRSLNALKYGRSALNGSLFFLLDYMFTHDIQLIHAHYGPMGEHAAILKQLGFQGKLYCTFHGFDLRGGLAKASGYDFSLLKRFADGIFAISRYSEATLLNLGFRQEQLLYLPNGIALKLRSKNHDSSDRLRLLSVGRLVPEKDYSTAFNALALLDQQSDNLNWDYSVVGGGELEADLKQLATQLGIRDKINFTGALDSQAVQEQYDQADLFLISSVTEVLPTVLLEAVSAGLPCVATAVGAVSEILGEKAYLVPTKDPNKLAEVLIMAIKERGQWESMIREQQQTLKDNYDMELILARLIDYYSA